MTIRSVPILLVAAAAGLSACGGGGDDATAAGDGQAAREAAQIKFSRCMREHGVELPDVPDGSGPRVARVGDDVDPGTLRAAAKACEKYRREAMPELTEEQRQEFQDQFLKFAACMREEGVDLPIPDFDGGGAMVAPAEGERPDFEDPEFQAAQKACEDVMPGRGGGVRFEARGAK